MIRKLTKQEYGWDAVNTDGSTTEGDLYVRDSGAVVWLTHDQARAPTHSHREALDDQTHKRLQRQRRP